METFSALLALCAGNSPVTGEFPSQRPVTWSFDVFFDLCLFKRLCKQSSRWWFEKPSRSLWRRCDALSPPFQIYLIKKHWCSSQTRFVLRLILAGCAMSNNHHKGILSWWRHQMESFAAWLTLCAGNSRVTNEFHHKGQWLWALKFSLICAWINDWVNNREAGYFRRRRAH